MGDDGTHARSSMAACLSVYVIVFIRGQQEFLTSYDYQVIFENLSSAKTDMILQASLFFL